MSEFYRPLQLSSKILESDFFSFNAWTQGNACRLVLAQPRWPKELWIFSGQHLSGRRGTDSVREVLIEGPNFFDANAGPN